METYLSRLEEILKNLKRIQQEAQQMLQDWESHIALWLIEDPLFFKNKETLIAFCIRSAPKWHPIFQDAFDSRRIALLDAIEEAQNAPEHLKKAVGKVKILLEMANRDSDRTLYVFSRERLTPINMKMVKYEMVRTMSLK